MEPSVRYDAKSEFFRNLLSGVQREDTKQVRELYVNPAGAKACPTGSFPTAPDW